jgi:preprotein translocase subunit SecE
MNTMVEQAQQAVAPADVAKYVVALLLAAGGIVAYYWFGQWPAPLRVLTVSAAIVAAFAVVATTAKGRQGRDFLSESLFELRKVVWPTQQEARRVTIVVLIVVVVVSLILSLFDLGISWVVRWLLGQ